MVGVKEFGLGSTLCFRREDLRAAGGFEAVADYIADDYQLSRRITGLGKHAVMSEVVVETHLNSPSWRQVWTHQVRWARTIRVSRLDGFLGLPVTHAGLWALVLLLAGQWVLAAALAGLRVLAGVAGGFLALRHRPALRLAALIPLWDVFAFAIWVTALTGNRVRWRAGALRLSGDGRITEITRD
jgi:ceramide glucosyltransferase